MQSRSPETAHRRLLAPVLAGVLGALAIAKTAARQADGTDIVYLVGAVAFIVLRALTPRIAPRIVELIGAMLLAGVGVAAASLGVAAAERAAPLIAFAVAVSATQTLNARAVATVGLVAGAAAVGARGGGWHWLLAAAALALPTLLLRNDATRRPRKRALDPDTLPPEAFTDARRASLYAARDRAILAMRAKTDFLAHTSHEIRTPLNGMMGTLTLLGATELDPTQEQYHRQLEKSSGDLLAIVNDVLDLSKLEAGALELDTTPFRVATVLENVAEVHGPAAFRKGVRLRLALDDAAFDVLRGDPLRLRHIVANLTSNAVKFTDDGGEVVLFCELLARKGDGCRLRLGVCDSGCGIASADIERITQPFAQADRAANRRHGGTGLGLSIAQRLVALMDAELQIDSEVGVGSTVAFELDAPWADGEEEQPHGTPLEGVRVALRIVDAPNPARLLLAQLGAELVDEANEHDLLIVEDDGEVEAPAGSGTLLLAPDVMAHEGAQARGFAGVVLLPWTRRNILEAARPLLTPNDRGSLRPPTALTGQLRILLAEDNDTNRMVMDGQLRIIGAVCDAVVNGEAAVAKWRDDGPYDLILMDLQMPVMDGYEATRIIRDSERADGGPRTPIVAVTANARAGTDKRALGVGFDDYVTKPFTLDHLREVIEQWAQSGPGIPPPAPPPPRAAVANAPSPTESA